MSDEKKQTYDRNGRRSRPIRRSESTSRERSTSSNDGGAISRIFNAWSSFKETDDAVTKAKKEYAAGGRLSDIIRAGTSTTSRAADDQAANAVDDTLHRAEASLESIAQLLYSLAYEADEMRAQINRFREDPLIGILEPDGTTKEEKK